MGDECDATTAVVAHLYVVELDPDAFHGVLINLRLFRFLDLCYRLRLGRRRRRHPGNRSWWARAKRQERRGRWSWSVGIQYTKLERSDQDRVVRSIFKYELEKARKASGQ
ncbi:MAG: hypothetical protein EB058_11105 [Proteobacteria bacterium]|nr:hypothetical protein [Pseudomonadota bacterium]